MPDDRSTATEETGAAGSGETLADLGEWELIRRLESFAPPGQFGDDAALVPLSVGDTQKQGLAGQPGGLLQAGTPQGEPTETGASAGSSTLVVNTDVLVEGIHFSDATTAAADVGWRAAAANLSDLAAMGCTEVAGITVGLVAPASTAWSWVEGVYDGLRQALDAYGGVLLGGDCSGGSQRMLAVTALGRLNASGGPIRRADGRPGDGLVCSGPHGLSRLGLALLLGEITASEVDPALIRRAIRAHQRPQPRFDAVQALIASRPVAVPWRLGGCDSSDGLAAAVGVIAAASGCRAVLDRRRLPLEPAMAALPEAEAWCLGGGEDFELVLALEPAWAEALLEALPGSTRIGELVAGEPGTLGWSDGKAWSDGDAWGAGANAAGYQHFH